MNVLTLMLLLLSSNRRAARHQGGGPFRENVSRFGNWGGMVAYASRHRVRKWLYLVEMMKSGRLENLALLLIPPWTLAGIE